MPIDRNAMKQQYEDAINGMLKSRTSQIGSALNGFQSGQVPGRSDFLNRGNAFSANLGLKPLAAPAANYGDVLDQNLNLNVANQKRGVGMDTANLSYQNALRGADFATGARQGAENYSTQAGVNQTNRDFQANMSAKERQAASDKFALDNGFQGQALQQQNQIQDENSSNMYQQALYRSLLGLGGVGAGVATISAMKRPTSVPTPSSYSPTSFGSSGNTYLDSFNSQPQPKMNLDWRKY